MVRQQAGGGGGVYERAAGATAGRRGWWEGLREVSGAAGSKRRPASLLLGLLALCWQQQGTAAHTSLRCMCVWHSFPPRGTHCLLRCPFRVLLQARRS